MGQPGTHTHTPRPGTDVTVSVEEVATALNRAADDIAAAADLPDTGTRDALNLLVNAALHYLTHPQATLRDVAQANYQTPLKRILRWIWD